MKLIALLSSYIVLCLGLLSPGGVCAITAENIALRQQLITLSRGKKHCRGLFQLPIAAQGYLVAYLNDIINI